MSQTLVKLIGGDLAALTPHLALSPEAAAVIAGCTEVPVALERLEQAGFLTEATRLVAHALPKREAVWWACMCVSHTAPPDLPSIDRAAREAAEEWVRQQTDKTRRIAFDHAQAGGCRTPGGMGGDRGVLERRFDVAGGTAGGPAGAASRRARRRPARWRSPRCAATLRGGEARLRRFLESGRNIAAGGPGRLPAETA